MSLFLRHLSAAKCASGWLVGLVQDISAMKGEFTKAFRKHRQENYRDLSESFLWHSTCQDNTIARMWQVHLSAVNRVNIYVEAIS